MLVQTFCEVDQDRADEGNHGDEDDRPENLRSGIAAYTVDCPEHEQEWADQQPANEQSTEYQEGEPERDSHESAQDDVTLPEGIYGSPRAFQHSLAMIGPSYA